MAASTSNCPQSGRQANQDSKQRSSKGKDKAKPLSTPNHQPVEASSWEDATPWNWTSLTDPFSGRVPPVFTKDGSHFFSAAGSSVKIHSTTTGLVVSTLTPPSPTNGKLYSDILTSVIINPHNAFQLLTASLDGRVMIWDFVNAILLQTVDIGQPIHHMCAHEQFNGFVFVAASRPQSGNDDNAVILQVFLKDDHRSQPTRIQPVGKTRSVTGLAVSPNGVWLVATAGHKVHIAKTSSPSTGFTKYVSPERLTCLAFHPFEEYFATGDDKGCIRLWYCLNDNLAVSARGVEKRTQTASFHWHAHAVSSVTFTPNGAYLLSGGEEAVLVIWQLHTGKKEFVPRVGAPISTVSISRSRISEEEYLLGLTDSTYTFISSASLKITRSYSRIKIDPATPQEWTLNLKCPSVPLAVQPLVSTLLLPSSHPSSLQVYSPLSATFICELEVSPSNRVSRRDDKPIIPSRVEKAVVSASGKWMATIDSRNSDAVFRAEVYLKFWSWSTKERNWVLNTRVDRPHGTHKVTYCSFSPISDAGDRMYLVTTGDDAFIKVWRRHQRGSDSESNVWVSSSTFAFRSERPGSLSWSPDASIFAVAVGPHVAVYDPIAGCLRQTLTSPECQATEHAHFVGASGRHFVTAGAKTIVLWDLIKSQVLWQTTTSLVIDRIIAHPREDSFAVFHCSTVNQERRTKVSIFRVPSCPSVASFSVPFGLQNVIWNSIGKGVGYSLVGITHDWRVVVLGDTRLPFRDDILTQGLNVADHSKKRTLFEDIFGSSAFSNADSEPLQSVSSMSSQVRKVEGNRHHELFDKPAYLMPAIDTLFDPLVTSLLSTRGSDVDPKIPEVDEEDEDVTMIDDTVKQPVFATRPTRISNQGEMELFTQLFRTTSISSTHPFLTQYFNCTKNFLSLSKPSGPFEGQ
ncbi:WD40 repeat-like protein [Phlegmacium glaucopus]|nr:WD40 repeat-like protein [Phlegmacium glaucopus]